jgi:hypothetical protein
MKHITGTNYKKSWQKWGSSSKIWGSIDNKPQQGHRDINTIEIRKSERRRLIDRQGDIAATHTIPYQPQHGVHGRNCGLVNLERLETDPTCVNKDTIRGITQVAGENRP